ncbi:FAD-dependent oxidoreductase [Legionella bononiensis]|uniref:FAD-dependent monooxygenase n=1 Tax=Legionella bononiensis TaxID=2793102 RepID=A0ABS1W729_9GAMM|nr:NAD(P)/FAD-dependent oxidoreductase [Legionella bononiensis]MBL7481273.1 FAD-dependent monooxygenase [Legionella bononiensis]MBL7525178.1 FAD-dependent monooxygenase [Legionella bononiensis]MBL7562902.1 FAD-dependent monooxygenase [Legionella bononiensis]
MLQIAVIGCGIAGPAAAIFLKQLNAEVTVFDKVENLKPVGAGFLLQPAGLDVLNHLGIVQSLISRGAPISGLHGINHKNKVVLDLQYADLVPHHRGLGIHRAVLYEELYKKMTELNIKIINPCEITGIENLAESVHLKDNQGTHYGPYDCVIIADGSRSQLRHSMNCKIKVTPYEWGALWAICQDTQHQFNTVLEQVYKHTEIMAGILPMGHQDKNLLISFFWSLHQSKLAQWKHTPFPTWKNQVLNVWPKLRPLFDQLHSHDQFAFASYSDVNIHPWHDNRVVIIGDAAHGMSPQLGQGANLGLIDAQILFECLRQYPVQKALPLYTEKRTSQLNYYQTASRFVTPWFQSSNRVMGFLRDRLHGTFCKTPLIKDQMLLTLACMKTGYFKSIPLEQYPPLFRPIHE